MEKTKTLEDIRNDQWNEYYKYRKEARARRGQYFMQGWYIAWAFITVFAIIAVASLLILAVIHA